MEWDAIVLIAFKWAIYGALLNFVIYLVALVTDRFTWPAWQSIVGGAVVGLAIGVIFGGLTEMMQRAHGSWGWDLLWLPDVFVAAAVVAALGIGAVEIQRRSTRGD